MYAQLLLAAEAVIVYSTSYRRNIQLQFFSNRILYNMLLSYLNFVWSAA